MHSVLGYKSVNDALRAFNQKKITQAQLEYIRANLSNGKL